MLFNQSQEIKCFKNKKIKFKSLILIEYFSALYNMSLSLMWMDDQMPYDANRKESMGK